MSESKCWISIYEYLLETERSVSQFWPCVNAWADRPHVLNRKLLGSELLKSFILPEDFCDVSLDFNEEHYNYFMNRLFLNDADVYGFSSLNINEPTPDSDRNENDTAPLLFFRKLIPRNASKFPHVLELVLKDKLHNVIIFWPKQSDVINPSVTPSYPYRIKCTGNCICLEVFQTGILPRNEVSENWLKSCVMPGITKWCYSEHTTYIKSLSLVSPTCYSTYYNYLKEKYGEKYIAIWTENSDPYKCVYEDIAIAAYLMTIWQQENKALDLSSKQTFVDIGCGNGLLVNILSSEGHKGIGIDCRKRKIWDLYEPHTNLIEKTVEPSDYNIFPDYDWIIGNHSDELTPWIPVIAARSSYKMKIFLLPCCTYTFNGKYERRLQGTSQYMSYISFIHRECETMGFVVQEDKLRIPSTKRICFVCTSRNYKEEEENEIDIQRIDFINKHSKKPASLLCRATCTVKEDSSSNVNIGKEAHWIENFKPRDRVEVVRNCTQLGRKFLETTVVTVAKILLETENYIKIKRASETILWNAGGKIKLGQLVELVDSEILKCMKNQCGGFQTFLRNHRSIFQIEDGYVQLNVPVKGIPLNSKSQKKRKNHRGKQYNFQGKPCYFYFNHPQGCPLEDKDCNFSHKNKNV